MSNAYPIKDVREVAETLLTELAYLEEATTKDDRMDASNNVATALGELAGYEGEFGGEE